MIICADDYGLRPDVDHTILKLVRGGKLSAVSCMVALARCDRLTLEPLMADRSSVDVGLHLCLTDEGQPVSGPSSTAGTRQALPSYGALLCRSLAGRLRPSEIRAQISAQYELFVEKTGTRPDYLDGHLHVHQLPGVRDVLVEFVASLPVERRPYVRNTRLSPRELRRRRLPWMKAALISAFGTRLQRRLRAAGIQTNDGFAGIYDFAEWPRYPELLPKFVACLPEPNGLLVTHPGSEEDWRKQEFATLDAFLLPAGRLNRFQR